MRFFFLLLWSAKCPHWLLVVGEWCLLSGAVYYFLWLPWQITTDSETSSNRNLFSHSSGGQRPEISVTGPTARYLQGCTPSRSCYRRESVPCLVQILVDAGIPCLVDALLQFSRSASSNLHLLLPHTVFSSMCINSPLRLSNKDIWDDI